MVIETRIFPPTAESLPPELEQLGAEASALGVPFSLAEIGQSREGRPLLGIRMGDGPAAISITAGAHSDEPAGPLAALHLVRTLLGTERGGYLLQATTWHICPHVNPDGAERNRLWFADPPDGLLYARHAFREPPGEDVEFNYPGGVDRAAPPRPENVAVAEFLREGAPYRLHASLHGMSIAEGAWWLIGADWVARTEQLRRRLRALFDSHDLGVHDIDRRGEKGFVRIAPGFATTPTSRAMEEFFLSQSDPDTARRFHPSSMEFVRSLGGDPLVCVSELPIFRIHGGGPLTDPPGDDTPFLRLRPRLAKARARLAGGDAAPLRALVEDFDLRPVPWDTQVAAISEAMLLSVEFLLSS